MPVIRIDDEVWNALEARAAPLKDSPNTVLRRLLGLGGSRAKAAATDTPLPTLRRDIAQVLRFHFRGPAPTEQILGTLNRVLAFGLTRRELERDETGDPRWWRRARAELAAMRAEGLVEASGSPEVLTLTEAGKTVRPDGTCGSGPSPA